MNSATRNFQDGRHGLELPRPGEAGLRTPRQCWRREEPERTIRILDAFRQLCVSGLVMHHLFREFSLTRAGFELARTISRQEVQILERLAADHVLGDS